MVQSICIYIYVTIQFIYYKLPPSAGAHKLLPFFIANTTAINILLQSSWFGHFDFEEHIQVSKARGKHLR